MMETSRAIGSRNAAEAAGPVAGGRDLRLDFFRGLSLFFIYIDHIPENVLSYFTLHSIAFCDAAEVFIFISGYTAALVYGQSLRRNGVLFATAQVYRRVWQLYVAHVFLFVIFTAEVSYVIAAQSPMYTEELRRRRFPRRAMDIAVIHALLLRFSAAAPRHPAALHRAASGRQFSNRDAGARDVAGRCRASFRSALYMRRRSGAAGHSTPIPTISRGSSIRSPGSSCS